MTKKRILCRMKPRDIKNGIQNNPWCCPIANCIQRTLDLDQDGVSVVKSAIELYSYEKGHQICKPSIRMQRFIHKFDNGDPVKPINFYLEEVTR